jgi:hypothetical protein
MNIIKHILYILILLCLSTIVGVSQTTNIIKNDLSKTESDEIIRKVTENEQKFRAALNNYVFTRKAVIQTIGLGGQVTGTFRRDSFFAFDKDGKRFEKIVFDPMPTVKDITITPTDIEDLGGITPYALQPSQVGLYNYTYLGKETIDELDLYVFEVSPKVIPNPKKSRDRVFNGRIWVDDRDFMIVKSKGKALPEGKDMDGIDQVFPIVETWRENVDGKYWFPSFATSDDELVSSNGSVVKIRIRVRYGKYGLGRSSVEILDDETPLEDAPKPAPTPKKPQF